MTTKMLPALCAALLLAACSGTDNGGTADGQPVASLDPNANGTGGMSPTTNEPISGSALPPGSNQEFDQTVGNTIHFDTDSYSLNTEAQAQLQKQAAWLQKYRQHSVTIEGHADERGTREYNLALGDRRATTVLNYLAALGIDKARLSEVSYGKEKPVCPDATDACWNENRRGVTALSN
jgi:peptidoglycan-associated lipoprotein